MINEELSPRVVYWLSLRKKEGGWGDNIGVNKPKRMFLIFSCELVILNDLPRTILNNSYARNKDAKTIANHTYHKVYNTCIKDDCYFYANQT